MNSILGQTVELTDEFKANYEKWLQREVYNTEIKWELLLSKEDRESLEKEIADYPLIEDFDQVCSTYQKIVFLAGDMAWVFKGSMPSPSFWINDNKCVFNKRTLKIYVVRTLLLLSVSWDLRA